LLAIGPEKLCLLDSKTKLLLKSFPASELRDWREGPIDTRQLTASGGACSLSLRRNHKHGLILEFRGTKPTTHSASWTLVAQSSDSLKSTTAALWDLIGAGSAPMSHDIRAGGGGSSSLRTGRHHGLLPALHRDIGLLDVGMKLTCNCSK
jgi:hypothetical protein